MSAGPLAYAFWHWKRSEVAAATYEVRQRAFQAALAADPPEGFLWGTTVRLSGAPWAAAGGAAYEDWYLVRDMAALERLNAAAVSAGRAAPHDAVALLAEDGIAGLYGLRGGAALRQPACSAWFAKPAGMGYAALDAALAPLLADGASALWSRRMTLGPTPEFCLQSLTPLELPEGFTGQRFVLEPLWGPQ
ncbi:MAG TPA: hypothetical protein VL241_00855 [Gemmatimonadales bacterium]|nr:hypothetical protein [Gemmatimonadales bacterium]